MRFIEEEPMNNIETEQIKGILEDRKYNLKYLDIFMPDRVKSYDIVDLRNDGAWLVKYYKEVDLYMWIEKKGLTLLEIKRHGIEHKAADPEWTRITLSLDAKKQGKDFTMTVYDDHFTYKAHGEYAYISYWNNK